MLVDHRFTVLGLMSVAGIEDTVVVPSSKPTILLAAMLLRPNEAVSTGALQRAVWGDEPPEAARATLQTYVLRLRRLFAKFGVADDAITTVPGGYKLPVTEGTLDLLAFRGGVRAAEAQDDPADELDRLMAALSLWQGPPLSNIHSEVLHREEVPRLHEEWLRATERRFQLELDLGQCRRALAELRPVARAHPGHEGLWQLLIEALYRTGRQAEALTEYRTVKQFLGDELGVAPGVPLRRLEMSILRGEDVGGRKPGSATTGGRPAARWPLPPGLPDFSGRDEESADLAERLTADGSGPAIVVVSGLPGVGKTALATHVAHQIADRFPDGCQFVSMAGRPTAGFGDGRRLLVLDDVTDVEQVRPLLPTSRGSAVLITSRLSLAELATTRGAQLHRLGVLEPARSRELLTAMLGPTRLAAEPTVADGLAETCGHLPLLLRLAATRLSLRPRHRIADVLAWLGDDPIGTLSSVSGAADLVAALRQFIGQLGPDLAGAFEVVSAMGTGPLPLADCVRALGLAQPQAAAVLERLVEANLVEDDPLGRYQVTALLREFAATHARPSLAG